MAHLAASQILGVGTSVPELAGPQDLVLRRFAAAPGGSEATAQLAARLFHGARVETRFFSDATFLKGDGPLPLERRMEVYREVAPRLAVEACRRALDQADVSPEQVSHLVLVSSTGALTPGPDADVMVLLGLKPSVERTLVAFMGCSGAFHGLRLASRAARDYPRARALLVCVEIASIHCRPNSDPGNIAAHALFGDGAAALVIGSGVPPEAALAELGGSRSCLVPQGRDLLTWELRPEGFEVNLSPDLPAFVEPRVREFIEPLLDGKTPAQFPSWAAHPGGPAILRGIERALALRAEALASSYEVLRSPGNLSSATVLFVLERELKRIDPGTKGVMLGFGPGLALEAVQYQRGGRASKAEV